MPATSTPPELRRAGARILVVDDIEDGRLVLQGLLRGAGYPDVALASSADETMALFGMNGAEPDPGGIELALLDVSMPSTDGIELCRRIKACEPLRDVQIIMVTAHTEESIVARAFEAGAIDYIAKPVRPIELAARVRSALRLKSEMDSRKARERELLEVARWLEEANASLRRLTTLDALTGAGNRRHFDAQLDAEWRRSARGGEPLAVVMIDIDYFKSYNDRFGHPAGDECLRRVAEALTGALQRATDSLSRYGGEEFAAVLSRTDERGALRVGEALRAAVAALRIPAPAEAERPFVTVSVGVASVVPPRNGTHAPLVAAADAALYEAKQAGRNRVAMRRLAPRELSSRLPDHAAHPPLAAPPWAGARVPRFWRNRERDVRVLDQAISRGDLPTIERLGRSLQAVGLGYGLRDVAVLGDRLSRAAEAGERGVMIQLRDELSALVTAARRGRPERNSAPPPGPHAR
jgi:diguanylate cyclase (GGDEF)-like protein